MLKQLIAIAVASSLMGCAATEPTAHAPTPLDTDTFNTRLNQQQDQLVAAINQQCQPADLTSLATLNSQVEQLSLQINHLNQAAKNLTAQKQAAVVTPAPSQCPKSALGDKFLLGEIENVFIDELNASFATRIDTGAESSSIDARNITLFERDGAQWVRFDVYTQGEKQPATNFESKVVRFVRIKQDANEKDDRRPVIHAHLKIGQYSAETDLNLTDRSHLDYPLLLGRKFIKDIAVVDVGQRYVHGKAKQPKATPKQPGPEQPKAESAIVSSGKK